MTDPFVSTTWLADRLDADDLAIVDASWHLPSTGRVGRSEYLDSHIPGAVFFGLDEIADHSTSLPHMLPSPDDFAEAVGRLGISEDMTILIYDEAGLFSAPRVFWTFRAMGARRLCILEGGGPRWREENRPLASGDPSPAPRRFVPAFDPAAFIDFEAMSRILRDSSAQVLDARAAARFEGTAPEPHPGLRSGHMPGSRNMPYALLTEYGALHSAEVLRDRFVAAGVDLDRPLVTTCGSGVTAAVLGLALERAGARQVAIYDGSWAEWGARKDTPIETGPGAR